MAQPNRSTSFVAAAAAVAVAVAVAVASLEDLAVAVRNYKSLALFLYIFWAATASVPFAPLFPHVRTRPELHLRQRTAQENVFYCIIFSGRFLVRQ